MISIDNYTDFDYIYIQKILKLFIFTDDLKDSLKHLDKYAEIIKKKIDNINSISSHAALSGSFIYQYSGNINNVLQFDLIADKFSDIDESAVLPDGQLKIRIQ